MNYLSFLYRASFQHGMKTNWCHYFIRILLDLYMFRTHRPIFRRVRTAVHTTIQSCSHNIQSTRPERTTNGCVNSCTNSPEDGPVGPRHVETQQYTNKIVTSVGFHSIRWKDARYKKLNVSHFEIYAWISATSVVRACLSLVVPYSRPRPVFIRFLQFKSTIYNFATRNIFLKQHMNEFVQIYMRVHVGVCKPT